MTLFKVRLTLLFAFALLATNVLAARALAAGPFVDIPEDFEFFQALQTLKSRNVIKGFPDQTFRPENSVTRAEFLKMATAAAAVKTPTELQEISFSDVSPADWFYEIVRLGKTLGLVKGYDDRTFRPHQGVSRVEALKILYQAYQVKPEFQDSNFSSDVSEPDWFAPYVAAARERWIMSDYDDGLFRPHHQLTRAIAAEVLYRFDQVYTENLFQFDITSEWESYVSPAGSFFLKMPRNWIVIPEVTRTVFWKADSTFFQEDYTFSSPFSAKLIVRHPIAVSEKTPAAYFESVKAMSRTVFGQDSVKFTDITLGSPALHVIVEERGLENWYLFLDHQKVLTVYGEFGKSSLSRKLRDTVRAMVRTLSLGVLPASDSAAKEKEQILNQIYANVLVEAKGKETLGSMTDEIILETDEIGVGTGPVDYYFSEAFDVTLKYERASDTILAVRVGKTTRF